MNRRQDWLWLGRWMKTRRQDRGTEWPKKLSVWWGERSLGVALRSISESTLKTTQIHESGASPQILHVSGASTLGPLFQWSLNFTLAFLGSPERKKHLLLMSGWFYPGWKAGVRFHVFLVVWAFITVNHICIGCTWYFCRSYVPTPSSSPQTHSSDSGVLALDLHNLMVWSQQTEVKETCLKSHSFTKWWSRVGFEPSLAPVILTIIHYRLANSVYTGLVKEL